MRMIDTLTYASGADSTWSTRYNNLQRAIDDDGIDIALVASESSVRHSPRAEMERTLRNAVAADSSGRIRFVERVNLADREELVEIGHHSPSPMGACAILVNPAADGYDLVTAASGQVIDELDRIHLPIIVSCGGPHFVEVPQAAEFARRCSSVPVVLTNGAQLNMSGLGQADAELALRHENVYIQTTGVYRDDWLVRVAAVFGSDRILFASCWPQFDMHFERRRVELSHLALAAKCAIFSENASRVFSL